MFQKSYHQLVEEKRRQLDIYRHTTEFYEDLRALRDEIEKGRTEAYKSLNDLLLNDFARLGIKYEKATWDTKKNVEGKPIKRDVRVEDSRRAASVPLGLRIRRSDEYTGRIRCHYY